jgi:hypothetical protein
MLSYKAIMHFEYKNTSTILKNFLKVAKGTVKSKPGKILGNAPY